MIHRIPKLILCVCGIILIAPLAVIGYVYLNNRNVSIDDNYRASQEDNIKEAALRYLFKHNNSLLEDNARTYFIAISDNDPAEEFMKRFKEPLPPVKRCSQCTRSGDYVKDKETGKRGMYCWIDSIEWINNNKVKAYTGYFETGLSAATTYSYSLIYENGEWIVSNSETMWAP